MPGNKSFMLVAIEQPVYTKLIPKVKIFHGKKPFIYNLIKMCK